MTAAARSPEEIRRTISEVLAGSDYQLDRGAEADGVPLIFQILRWLLKPLRWLAEQMDGLPDWLSWVIIGLLLVVLIALVFHIVWSFTTALRPHRSRSAIPLEDDPGLTPEALETQAREAYADGRFIDGVRTLFRAALLRIESAEERKFRIGLTNRELLRRYANTSLHRPLRLFVETIDRKWYGHELCEGTDYEHCREAYETVRTVARRGPRSSGPTAVGP